MFSSTVNGKGWEGKTKTWVSKKEHMYEGDGGGTSLKNWCAIKEGRSTFLLDVDPVPEGVVPALSPRHLPTSVLQLRQEIQTEQGSKPREIGEDKRKNKRLEIEMNQRHSPKALQDLEKKLRHKLKMNPELEDLETKLKMSQELDNVAMKKLLNTEQQKLDSAATQNHNTRHNNPESEMKEHHYGGRGGERKSHETQNQKENEEKMEEEGVVGEREAIVNPEAFGLPEGCEYMERGIFTSAVCSGANITTVPTFPLSHQLESLHFYDTGIQMVSDISGRF